MQQYYSIKKDKDTLYLNHDDLYHIKKVMRMKKDDKIIVVYDKKSFVCKLNPDLSSANIIEIFKDGEKYQKILVYIPMLSDDKMSFVFKYGTTLGITDFVVVQYSRCKYKLLEKDYNKKLDRWRRIIKEASEQSYRIKKPILQNIIKFQDIEALCNVNILCSLDKNNVNNLCKVLTPNNCNDTISLVFGPEGGLCEEEEDLLNSKGFIKTSLGNNVLRTEIVPIMVSSVIQYLRNSD